jgi:hypothetical protein
MKKENENETIVETMIRGGAGLKLFAEYLRDNAPTWVVAKKLFEFYDKEGKKIHASKKFKFDNSYSQCKFIEAGLIIRNEKRELMYVGPEIITNEDIQRIKDTLKKPSSKVKEKETEKVSKKKALVLDTMAFISKEEFIKLHLTTPDIDTIPETLNILSLIYIENRLITTPKSSQEAFKVFIPGDNGPVKIDARDFYMLNDEKKKRNSQITLPILKELKILDDNNVWIGGAPTKKMATDVNAEARYRVYLYAESSKMKKAIAEKLANAPVELPTNVPVEEKTDVSEPTQNFPGTLELNVGDESREAILAKLGYISEKEFSTLTITQKLDCLYKCHNDSEVHRYKKEERDKELEEQRSRNTYETIRLLSKGFNLE